MKKYDFSAPIDPDEEIEYVSKSELKREAQRFIDLGKRITDTPTSRWDDLPLSDNLRAALKENLRLTQNEAKRRHMHYIGKLMRNEDTEAIAQKLDELDPSSEAFGRVIKQAEMWRTQLLEKDGLNRFIETYPEVDRQQLRNLLRNAQKEVSSEPPKPGTNYKKLFQLIKEAIKN
ncbi:MAG: ribosome biogenesis factor YjgA [Venatoribacter sp.]